MSRGIVNVLGNSLAFFERRYLREVVIGLLQFRLAFIEFFQRFAQPYILAVEPNGKIDKYEMNQQNQEIVERLCQHAEDRRAFPVAKPIGGPKGNDVHHHTQRTDDYGREHFFRTDIKFGENDHIECA